MKLEILHNSPIEMTSTAETMKYEIGHQLAQKPQLLYSQAMFGPMNITEEPTVPEPKIERRGLPQE